MLQASPDRLEVEVLGIPACRAHRHRFDQAKNKALLDAEIDHFIDFIVIHAPHRDHIDLDRREAGLFGGLEAGQDLGEDIAPADCGNTLSTKRIQADIDALHSGLS
jgi:hypothetical protein